MDDNKKKYTEEDLKDWLIKQAMTAKNSEDTKNYSQSVSFLKDSETKENTAYEKMDIEKQNANEDRELKQKEIDANTLSTKVTIVTTIISGVLTIASIIIGRKVEGKEDRRYQEEGYNHEKTEGVIYKYTKHAKPKHGPLKIH